MHLFLGGNNAFFIQEVAVRGYRGVCLVLGAISVMLNRQEIQPLQAQSLTRPGLWWSARTWRCAIPSAVIRERNY